MDSQLKLNSMPEVSVSTKKVKFPETRNTLQINVGLWGRFEKEINPIYY